MTSDPPGGPPGGAPAGPPVRARRRGWGLVRVAGRSMRPTLAEGDRLLVRWGVPAAAPGRLVLVRLPGGRPVSVKRLVRREPEGWWVERDNPEEGMDSWHPAIGAVQPDDLLGVVVARVWPRPGRVRRG